MASTLGPNFLDLVKKTIVVLAVHDMSARNAENMEFADLMAEACNTLMTLYPEITDTEITEAFTELDGMIKMEVMDTNVSAH